METRNIVNNQGQIIGQMSLPENTSEEVWQQKISAIINPPQSPSPQEIVVRKINSYKKECEQLMDTFKAGNTLEGITVAQSAELFAVAHLVIIALREGALPTAIYLAEQIVPAGFLTQEKKDLWISKMKEKL